MQHAITKQYSNIKDLGAMKQPLYHYSTDEIPIVVSCPQERDPFCYWSKPDGLWLSVGTAWYDFMINDDPECLRIKYLVMLKKNAKIACVDDVDSAKVFTKRFTDGDHGIEWDTVALYYDGIYMSPTVDVLEHADWTTGWDIPSVCVWNTTALHVVLEYGNKVLIGRPYNALYEEYEDEED